MPNNYELFIAECKHNFGERLICIIGHGSNFFESSLNQQDMDLVIVLNNKEMSVSDLTILNAIVAKLKQNIDLQLFYSEELPQDADHYSQNTNGCFFAWHLRGSELLYGTDIFNLMHGPNNYQMHLSLLQKIRQYAHKIRQEVINNREQCKVIAHSIRKYLLKMIKDMLMLNGVLEQNQPKQILSFRKMYPNLLSVEEFESIDGINSNNPITLMEAFKISEKIYNEALKFARENIRFKPLKS